MALYDDVKNAIQQKYYSLLDAQGILNVFLRQLQITADQYEELMELADELLNPNSESDEEKIEKVQLEKRLEAIETRLDALEKAVEEGGTEIEKPETPDGSTKETAITAYAGMTYYKGKYYKDPTDEQVYICTRDRDDQPGTGIALYYTPSQLVNIYFALAE